MLVAKDRHYLLGAGESPRHFLEEPAAWVEDLALLVLRVLAVLADAQDALDRQLVAAERQGFVDGRTESKAVFLRQIAAQIAGRELIHVERNELEVKQIFVVMQRAFQDLADDNVRVRVARVDSDRGGDGLGVGHLLNPGRQLLAPGRWRRTSR